MRRIILEPKQAGTSLTPRSLLMLNLKTRPKYPITFYQRDHILNAVLKAIQTMKELLSSKPFKEKGKLQLWLKRKRLNVISP
jgi:hypothetical protein